MFSVLYTLVCHVFKTLVRHVLENLFVTCYTCVCVTYCKLSFPRVLYSPVSRVNMLACSMLRTSVCHMLCTLVFHVLFLSLFFTC